MRLVAARRFVQRHRRALVCRAAVDLMTAYLEGALGAADQRKFESHLVGCIACTQYLSQMRATVEVLGCLEPEDLPTAVVDELVELYRQVIAS